MTNHNVLLLVTTNITQRLKGIHRLAGKCGWTIHTGAIASPPEDWSGDGVIVMLDGSPEIVNYIRRLRARRIPVVDIVENCPEIKLPRVTGDDLEIGRLAAEHFNERNFHHAVFFSAVNDYCHGLRFKGFQKAWRGTTLKSWLWPEESKSGAISAAEMQAWLVARLRATPKPLAVFAWNDTDAVHMLNACRAAGLSVPEDVAILGVDNKEMICEHQAVKLSSIAHDLERIGYVAAATLERLMSGGRKPELLTRVKPRGVITRESSETIAFYDPELRPALHYILKHLSEGIGGAQIADALHMPRIRLDRLFAAKLGHSVGVEITRHRVAKAKHLLKTTHLTLNEIAVRCGYCNASFLIRNFRRMTGTTPRAWKEK